jgi:hypothetical protein
VMAWRSPTMAAKRAINSGVRGGRMWVFMARR